MLKIIAFVAVIGLAQSYRITRAAAAIPILKSELGTGTDGEYIYSYEGADGTYRREKSVPMNVGEEDEYLAIIGSYRYIDGEGITVEVHYTAGPQGFVITETNVGQSIENAGKTIQANLLNDDNQVQSSVPVREVANAVADEDDVVAENTEETSDSEYDISADLVAPDFSENDEPTNSDTPSEDPEN